MISECALAIIKKSGKFLYSLRSKDPFFQYYEFPGGKVEINESPEEALIRECYEELDISVTNFNKIGFLTHNYNNLSVKLYIFEIIDYEGKITSKEKQKLLYLNAYNSSEKFIESTYRILNYLSLPRLCRITSNHVLDNSSLSISLPHILRYRSSDVMRTTYIQQAKEYSKKKNNSINLILDAKYSSFYQGIKYTGLHYTSSEIRYLNNSILSRSNNKLTYSASCHNIDEINIANKFNFDFILLSPILKSKGDIPAMGWDKFQELSTIANMPVYALGGVDESDLNICVSHNGYGVSGISKF